VLCDEEHDEEWECADGVDDGPHSDAPVPGRGLEDGRGQVARDPGVDLREISARVGTDDSLLTTNGNAGTNEKNNLDLVDVRSATITSTNKMIIVYPT
jgi:hypothetical protein